MVMWSKNEANLIAALKNGDPAALETIYNGIAAELLRYINTRVNDRGVSEELLQEVFLSLWDRREALRIESSLKAYLYAAAKFQVLNHIRAEKVRQRYAEHFSLFALKELDTSTEDLLDLADLKAVITQYLAQLPYKCQQAFMLSRFEHHSIAEIAEKMGISTRTVENYLSQALRHLRAALKNYHWVFLFF